MRAARSAEKGNVVFSGVIFRELTQIGQGPAEFLLIGSQSVFNVQRFGGDDGARQDAVGFQMVELRGEHFFRDVGHGAP